eukprot:6274087-Amphidinium_carterae.1
MIIFTPQQDFAVNSGIQVAAFDNSLQLPGVPQVKAKIWILEQLLHIFVMLSASNLRGALYLDGMVLCSVNAVVHSPCHVHDISKNKRCSVSVARTTNHGLA